jgi:hypothetical protein
MLIYASDLDLEDINDLGLKKLINVSDLEFEDK